ncbi:MAG: hypothetical protein VB070_07935 [Clostridiaceae bacterium]|nr:hypothetical protein [Clostridiaceae bacterium]
MNHTFEQYHPLFNEKQGHILRPGQTFSLTFDGGPFSDSSTASRLFFTGETALFYQWKNEPDYPLLYRLIDDALDYEHAGQARYCLNMSAADLDYPKRVYKKLLWKPILSYLPLYGYAEQWQGGLWIKTNDLKIGESGFLHMIFEVRLKKPGISRHNAADAPDAVYVLDIPPGACDWTRIDIPVNIPTEETASVCVFLEGIHYQGTVYLERPFLISSNGYNILPDFSPAVPQKAHFSWLGQNLSRKEWPEFKMSLNGRVFFQGEIFERSHRYSETEKELPRGLIHAGPNLLELELISAYREALPYAIFELGLIQNRRNAFNIIACPEQAAAGRPFGVLIKTREPDLRLTFDCPSGLVEVLSELSFPAAGLHVIKLESRTAANQVAFSLNAEACREQAVIQRILYKTEDDVITGTGDMIYINQDSADSLYYLQWYCAGLIGNLLTVRPTYRWSGTRELNSGLWPDICRLLNELNIKYVHMMDGRELPGSCANPPLELMAGQGFLGRQRHEQDGAYAYWGFNDFTGQEDQEAYIDLWLHLFRQNIRQNQTINLEITPPNVLMNGETLTLYRDPALLPDMEQASAFFVSQLAKTRYNTIRHTGPSVLFKYFFQAGYTWNGAELMYGPMEMVISALRGAAACYGQSQMGGHLAVQWSTTPHDTPERFERYRLALFISYIQGLTEINTEEGLWHMEEYYSGHSRFSKACRGHLRIQQDFYRYVSSHTRTGRFYTPIAFLQGRYDGWQCFGRGSVWGQREMEFGKPEASWDLLKCFYPLSVPDAIYRHPCQQGPAGFYTGTPRGSVDIIPVEGPAAFRKYKMLSFLGYHKALPEDFDALLSYVSGGGLLLLGWPHCAVTTGRADVVACRHEYLHHEFLDRIGGEEHFSPCFVSDTLNGEPVQVAANLACAGCSVLVQTDRGRALVIAREIGQGTVYFINAGGYPAETALQPVYEKIIGLATDKVLEQEAEQGLITCGEDVQYTIYQQEDGSRHLYIMAVDTWYHRDQTDRSAELIFAGNRYAMAVPADTLLKVVVKGEWAVWLTDDVGELISLEEKRDQIWVRVQGTGRSTLLAACRGKIQTLEIDFSVGAAQSLPLHLCNA